MTVQQNTPKCVENCSDDQLSYHYNSENSVFFGQIPDKLSW